MNHIFNLLNEKTQDPTYYLKSLNYLNEVNLEIYKEISNSVSAIEIQELFDNDNWRAHLVAYMLVLSNRKLEFLEPLKNRLIKGSFISPQIIVAIVILGSKQASQFLLSILAGKNCSSKIMGAIVAVLPYCSIHKLAAPEMEIDLGEFNAGFNIAQEHILFWKKIERSGQP